MEEIEELRARAIASMPSSSNPRSAAPAAAAAAADKSKSPESKEEGELSPSDDTAAIAAELPGCSTAFSNSTMLDEHLSANVIDNHVQTKSDCPTVKTLPSSCPSMANVQIQSSVKRNYSKHFKKMQVPFKSMVNQSLSWHGKASDDNLVISFSDDDSGSNSEESTPQETISMKGNITRGNVSKNAIPEKTTSRKVNISRTFKSDVPIAAARVSSMAFQGPNRSKYVLKKGLVNPASNPPVIRASLISSRHLATSSKKDSPILKDNSNIKTSARQEHDHVPDPVMSNHRLTNLRHEISLRENELKGQSKSIPQGNKMNAGSYSDKHGPQTMYLSAKAVGVHRPASVAGIGLAPREKMTKRLRSVLGSNSKQSSAGQLQLPISSNRSAHESSLQHMEESDCLLKGGSMDSCNDQIEKQQHDLNILTQASSESSLKVKDGRPLVPVSVAKLSASDVSPMHGNYCKAVTVDSHSRDKPEKINMDVDYPTMVNQRSCLPQSDPSTENRALCESNVSHNKHSSIELRKQSSLSGPNDSSSLVPRKKPGQHSMMRTQQIATTAGVQVHLKTPSLVSERCSGQLPERKSGNVENACRLDYSGQINMSGEAGMSLQSLMELEELQDKELEEAQELRHRCELEERRALKAYRKAQRALIDANEKCNLLYRKRELFSAQHGALLMQASGSLWPQGWQNYGGTVSDSVENLPEACKTLLFSLGHQLPVEGPNLGQLGKEPNTRHLVEPQPHAICRQLNEHDFASGQYWEQDASALDHRDNNALDGVMTPAHHPNMSTDDENFPADHRSIESRLAWDSTEDNRCQTTDNMNAEIGILPSDENAQDYELLEASLRSKLVKRFGHRISYKNNNTGKSECLVQEQVPDKSGAATNSPLPGQQMLEGDKTGMSCLEGIEMLRRSTNEVTARSLSHGNGFSLSNKAQRIGDSESPIQTAGSTLPSSILHVVSGHAKSTLHGCFSELSVSGKKEAMLCEKFSECTQGENINICSTRFANAGEMELHSYDFAINHFWPFCMFELRGKCNNEECQWQHVKESSMRNSMHNDYSDKSYSDGQANHLSSVGKSDDATEPPNDLHISSIPAYHIGSSIIKVDSHLSRSVLARSIWQYWRRGFCASFLLPFSIQRILPPDVPSLQSSDGPVADDCWWNRLSLYYQTMDYSMKELVHGLPESEQSLEMALDLFDGSICKPDGKKALCMLSRAIEVEPTSVALWVVYLHIFYGKEKNIGKDDMFFHAVQHNEDSYELWLLYINSRVRLGDRLDAYEYALNTFCRNVKVFDEERRYASAYILDIFLQMIDFLCMSGDTGKAIQEIFGLLGNCDDTLLSNIYSCLIVSDRCLFWFCCIYLVIYRKLPEPILQQFEFEKELPFGTEWPSADLTPDTKERALDLMKLAVDKMVVDSDMSSQTSNQVTLRSLHFLAVCHIRCVSALEGLQLAADLLATYLSLFPTCIELILISARMKENDSGDGVLNGFEQALCNWPKETSGTQCLWNQYVEHVLADGRIDLAEIILTRWFQCFYKDINQHLNSEDSLTFAKQDALFGYLNLSLYRLLQKNLREAQCAIDKALKLSSPQDYRHCVREHAAFTFAHEANSKSNKPWGVLLGLISGYVGDSRLTTILEPLSRKYHRYIKKPRVWQLINNIFGPVSKDCTFVNYVLEACYGTSLLPEKIDDPKGFADFVEALMEMIPANYKLALAAYKLTTNFSNPFRFWACSILINSVLQAVPVAPEHVWIEAANAMRNLEILEISLGFHQQAVSVYPFSLKLWQSYMDVCRNTDKVDTIVELAGERGIELGRLAD